MNTKPIPTPIPLSTLVWFRLGEMGQGPLVPFIRYLQWAQKSRVLHFAHAGRNPDLIQNLSVRDNLLLQHTHHLSAERDRQPAHHIERHGNPFLMPLMECLPFLDIFPFSLNAEQKKVVSFLNAILKDAPILFLSAPSEELRTEYAELVTKAIEWEYRQNGKSVFLTHPDDQLKKLVHFTVDSIHGANATPRPAEIKVA